MVKRYESYVSGLLPESIINLLYRVRVAQLTFDRHIRNMVQSRSFATQVGLLEDFPYLCKRHQSLIRRRLGDNDPVLQENKAINLAIALKSLTNIIIGPGQIFSFCWLFGRPIRRNGYVEGLQLSKGEVKRGIGGGLCQLTNLLYWMALHSPLDVVERHHHSFDPFPDDRRTLPFGTGAGVFYNYIDLRFKNNTKNSFMIHLSLTDKHLMGKLLSDQPPRFGYHIEEENHRFIRREGKIFRENDIFRRVTARETGTEIRREWLMHNLAQVKYKLPDSTIITSEQHTS